MNQLRDEFVYPKTCECGAYLNVEREHVLQYREYLNISILKRKVNNGLFVRMTFDLEVWYTTHGDWTNGLGGRSGRGGGASPSSVGRVYVEEGICVGVR